MRLQKSFSALFLAVLLFCSVSMAAYAHDVPDASKKGFISVQMTYDNQPVAGGFLTLYRVGEVKEDDGNYSFALSGDFTASEADLSDISSAALAKELAQYAENRKLSGKTAQIGDDGEVSFTELELGLYLLVQNEAADGYHKAAPFMVSVPMNENGTYIYTVDASPKVELQKAPVPETPVTPKPVGPTLPQTGQLNWPIPVLAVLGLGLFSVGWLLRFGRKRGCYEK